MGTDIRAPKLGGGESATESSGIRVEGSQSGAGKGGYDVGRSGGGHVDAIQSNGTENEVNKSDWRWAEIAEIELRAT